MEEQRKSHKGLWVIGAVVVILLFCAFFFRVKKVSIEGNTYYSSREMEEKFQSNIFEKNITKKGGTYASQVFNNSK